MKHLALSLFLIPCAYGSALYTLGDLDQDSLPLNWTLSIDGVYDDNTSPGIVGAKDETFAVDTNVGVSFRNVNAQTTLDVYARLGVLYYMDAPVAFGADEAYEQARAGLTLNHSFNERIRFVSTNYLGYELEPNYVQGFASSRTGSAQYFFLSSENAVGYRWTERFGTFSGIRASIFDLDQVQNADRTSQEYFNQFRYQLNPQSVITSEYRYSTTSGSEQSSDIVSHFFLVGTERRFSATNTLVVSAGAQMQESDRSASVENTNPYLEFNLNTAVNSQFSLQSFVRYGSEVFDTVVDVPVVGISEYDQRLTLRVGVNGAYELNPSITLNAGVNVVNTSFENGRRLDTSASVFDADENLINAHIGTTVKITEYLNGNLTYNFTNSSSDLVARDFDRNRISIGLSTQF
jgi:hypothetical protein